MKKISQSQASDLLHKAAHAIRVLTRERDAATEKLAAYERRDQAIKVAAEMHQKGLRNDVSFTDLVTDLEKAAQEGKLDRIATAVDLVGPDMSEKIAQITDAPAARVGISDFESFVLSLGEQSWPSRKSTSS